MDHGELLDNCSWYDKWQFSADISNISLLQIKAIENLGSTVTQYLTMHVSILDQFEYFNINISRSRKVKYDSVIVLSIH